MKHKRAQPLALALVAGLAACGGASGNAKLKSRVTDQHLAPMTSAERGHEADLYREVFLAAWQIEYTKAQIDAADLELKLAKNDLASAKIGMKSAGIEAKAAEETGELNKMAETKGGERIAQLEIDMHKLKIDRAKANVSYLKKRLDHEERLHRSREAELESIKADAMKGAGIKPPGFEANTYKAQFKDRSAQAKASEAGVAESKKELAALDAKLASATQAVEAAKSGGPAKAPEPVETSEPLESPQPIDPVIPVEPAEPAAPEKPAPADAGDKTPPASSSTEPGATPAPKGN